MSPKYAIFAEFPSKSNPDKEHSVKLNLSTLKLSCDCKSWVNKSSGARTCKHVELVASEFSFSFPYWERIKINSKYTAEDTIFSISSLINNPSTIISEVLGCNAYLLDRFLLKLPAIPKAIAEKSANTFNFEVWREGLKNDNEILKAIRSGDVVPVKEPDNIFNSFNKKRKLKI